VPRIAPLWKEGWNHPPGREISKDVVIWHKEFLGEIPLIFFHLNFIPLFDSLDLALEFHPPI
jgi:hypothetical protein